jgi:dTDP-4-amino-4,6-dideoxygalactose transaminase
VNERIESRMTPDNPIPVPLMDPARGYRAYREEIDAAVRATLEAGSYILGPAVAEFETRFSQWGGLPSTVAVANGTDAIHLALRTLGVGDGAVLTVSHTAVATVAAIELAGAAPVLVDVDPVTLTIDVTKLEDSIVALAHEGVLRPKAVVAVHLYGHPCDVAALRDICDRHGLFLIEDCAQAHGARVGGASVGTFGDAAAFSFYPTKNLAAFGDGGAVSFRSVELAERCRALREYGWRERYISSLPGLNSRLDELQAAILNVRIRHLDDEVAARRRVAGTYNEALAPAVDVPTVRAGYDHAFHLYVIRTRARAALRDALRLRRIGNGIHYPVPVHRQPAYMDRVRIGAGGMAVTDAAKEEILSLPMHPFLSVSEIESVGAAVNAWAESQ